MAEEKAITAAAKERRLRARKSAADDAMTRRTQEATQASPEPGPAPQQTLQPEKRRRGRPRKHAGDAAEGAAQAKESAPAQKETPAEQPQAQPDGSQDKGPQGQDKGFQDKGPAPRNRQRNGNGQGQNQNQGHQGGRRGRYNKNRREFAQAEPSLTKEELEAMKVAELREKAKELELPYQGLKKAELVSSIYEKAAALEGFHEVAGILDIVSEGYGFIRTGNYMHGDNDAFVPQAMIRQQGLRRGDLIEGSVRPSRPNDRYPALSKIAKVNGMDPALAPQRPRFRDLTPIFPDERLRMETFKDEVTGRAIDIVAPIGKGQRGLIVSPPKAGKTTVLKRICQAISHNDPDVHLICLLVDERPEEVTDMERSIRGDVVASTFDMPADNHTQVAELVIERAKRLVEQGEDVVVVLDSITRLARAYNLAAPPSGRILSGGVDSAALYPPKRFLGAARNIENGGSLTIIASALIDTGSKMDEVIFEEFKGTGNMELKLDRTMADKRIFPAIDPVASGTRNEDRLMDPTMAPLVWGLRRVLANMNNVERAEASLIKGLKNTQTNQEFLVRSARKAAQTDYSD